MIVLPTACVRSFPSFSWHTLNVCFVYFCCVQDSINSVFFCFRHEVRIVDDILFSGLLSLLSRLNLFFICKKKLLTRMYSSPTCMYRWLSTIYTVHSSFLWRNQDTFFVHVCNLTTQKWTLSLVIQTKLNVRQTNFLFPKTNIHRLSVDGDCRVHYGNMFTKQVSVLGIASQCCWSFITNLKLERPGTWFAFVQTDQLEKSSLCFPLMWWELIFWIFSFDKNVSLSLPILYCKRSVSVAFYLIWLSDFSFISWYKVIISYSSSQCTTLSYSDARTVSATQFYFFPVYYGCLLFHIKYIHFISIILLRDWIWARSLLCDWVHSCIQFHSFNLLFQMLVCVSLLDQLCSSLSIFPYTTKLPIFVPFLHFSLSAKWCGYKVLSLSLLLEVFPKATVMLLVHQSTAHTQTQTGQPPLGWFAFTINWIVMQISLPFFDICCVCCSVDGDLIISHLLLFSVFRFFSFLSKCVSKCVHFHLESFCSRTC